MALIGALDRLTPGRLSPHEVAYTAHAVEVEMLKQQSGIQDQLCSAYGGINYIEMQSYPFASVSQVQVSNTIWWELERRLALIYLGKTHVSSQVHEKVIAELQDEGPDTKRLQDLRVTAEKSRDAVYAGDFVQWETRCRKTQQHKPRLHPDLVSEDARQSDRDSKVPWGVGVESEWCWWRGWVCDPALSRVIVYQTGNDYERLKPATPFTRTSRFT